MNLDKPDVFVVADNIFSPLGKTISQNFSQLKQNASTVKQHANSDIADHPFHASLFSQDEEFINVGGDYTKFEKLLIASITETLRDAEVDVKSKKTALIISSTKGNISLLENGVHDETLFQRISLSTSALLVADHFGFVNKPIIVSNACVSGVLAVITGMRLLRTGGYENVVIAGADVISKFILSGFESFQALSRQVCRPFDKSRNGLSLGEGAATIILSTNKKFKGNFRVKGGSVSNDANHISGPSRTGRELAFAIDKAIHDASLTPGDIDFISAHGTATVYNDEMEALAISAAGLQQVPVNSLKSNYGHTLGAAGLIESVVSLQSLRENYVLPTLGFSEKGVSSEVNICANPLKINANNFLKTSSGFGGCNAAVIFGT